jgi:hypothetical protein
MRGPGINAAVGVLIYFLMDWWPDFGLLAPKAKRLLVMMLCLLVPLLATLASVATLGLPISDWPGTWWPAIVAGITVFTASTALHTRDLPSG